MASSRQQILIIGSGWAGSTLSKQLSSSKFDITVISPTPNTPYTPLLASAACGLYDFSLVETPIRDSRSPVKFIQGKVRTIDFERKTVRCRPFFNGLEDERFQLTYDIIVLAPGCLNQTFGTPGVVENACFVRKVADAMMIRQRVADCFEKASLPGRSDQQQRDLLHFVIVGGGPTGIELSAELCDLFENHFARLYPHLKGKASVAIHDVAPQILSVFDLKLQEYALSSFSRRGVDVVTNSHIQHVDEDSITTAEKGRIPAGLVIWATGNRCTRLVESLPVQLTSRLPRIVTDECLRVYGKDGQIFADAYALGDAADIRDSSLPTTAEVACQKAEYLAKSLNHGVQSPFKYEQKAVVAYLGQKDGVIAGGDHNLTGQRAWLAWRSKNFWWTRSWRQKVLVVVAWVLDWGVGRGISAL